MSQYLPIRFVDVRLEGDFWRERLDTVPKGLDAAECGRLVALLSRVKANLEETAP